MFFGRQTLIPINAFHQLSNLFIRGGKGYWLNPSIRDVLVRQRLKAAHCIILKSQDFWCEEGKGYWLNPNICDVLGEEKTKSTALYQVSSLLKRKGILTESQRTWCFGEVKGCLKSAWWCYVNAEHKHRHGIYLVRPATNSPSDTLDLPPCKNMSIPSEYFPVKVSRKNSNDRTVEIDCR